MGKGSSRDQFCVAKPGCPQLLVVLHRMQIIFSEAGLCPGEHMPRWEHIKDLPQESQQKNPSLLPAVSLLAIDARAELDMLGITGLKVIAMYKD